MIRPGKNLLRRWVLFFRSRSLGLLILITLLAIFQIMALIPGRAAPGSVKLANRPKGGEEVPMDALNGRKVGDMGFKWVEMQLRGSSDCRQS